jgi:hypothetical protein
MAGRMSGHVRRQLVIDLAKGDLSNRDLSGKYDIAEDSVNHFARRNEQEIAAVRRDAADAYAGLWSAEKAMRLAELQQDVDELGEILVKQFEEGEVNDKLLARKHKAINMIAEELGQLPTRVTAQVEGNVEYRIVGVNPTDVT